MTAGSQREGGGDVNRVREATDIVAVVSQYVALTPAGENLKGLCPFHQDSKPSFTVSPAKQLYYCFGCGEGGDVFKFVMKVEGLDFADALKKLAARAGITLTGTRRPGQEEKARDRLGAAVAEAEAFFFECLRARDPYADEARRYLEKRGLERRTLDEWRVGLALDSWDALLRRATRAGFSPEDLKVAGLAVTNKDGTGVYDRFRARVIFPIWNASGQVVAFGGRLLGEGEPKYLNSSNTPLYNKSITLYGFHRNRAAIARSGRCIVVEGYLDLLGLWQVGIENVVATCGTALAEEAATALARYVRDFILLYDGDDAGVRAARRAAAALVPRGARVRVAEPPAGKDPFDLAMDARAAADAVLEAAAEWPDFLISLARREHGADDTAVKLAVMREAGPLVAAMPDDMERRFWRQRLADRLGIAVEGFEMPAPARPGAATAPCGEESETERNFLRVLVQHPALAAEALAAIELEDVADEAVRNALRVMGRLAKKGEWGLVELLDELDEEGARLVVTLSMAQAPLEDGARAAGLCVRALKERSLKRRSRAVKEKVARGEGGEETHDDIRALVEERRRLLGKNGQS